MGSLEVIARRAAGQCIGCGHDVHPTERCSAPKGDGACGVEELLALDELGL
ncbi:hypothetical protein [Streptomyces sp. H51]|uniref:hypothetical protein n=1 Tax=Streptomyces sp. H51 TaxID=3111770 RepID=UPI002D7874CD|nr:hypothetical protein [Streptomyces sp. H51]